MIRTRYGASPWIDGVPPGKRPRYPVYRGSTTAPIVIVGGGLTGCMTAYACAAAGQKVLLLEAERLGQAGSGRGPGWIAGEACDSFHRIEQDHGRRVARAVFTASASAPRELLAAVGRLRIRAGLELRTAMRILAAGGSDTALRREVADRASIGLDAAWMTPSMVAKETAIAASGGARLRGWGVADPYRLAIGFAAAAVKRGVSCHEGSRVTGIDVTRQHVLISLEHGEVVAGTVIVCTGAPTDLFTPLRRHFRVLDRYLVQTDAIPAPVRAPLKARAAVLCDTEAPAHVLWFTSDGRALFSGADQKAVPARQREQTIVQRTGQLMYELTRLYPDISGVAPANGWDVRMASAADDVLLAGPHRHYPRHLFALGTAHDPARAFLASRILLRHLLGTATRDDEGFAFSRLG